MSQVESRHAGTLFVYVGPTKILSGWFVAGAWVPGWFTSLDMAGTSVLDLTQAAAALVHLRQELLAKGRQEHKGAATHPRFVEVLVADTWLASASAHWDVGMRNPRASELSGRECLAATGSEVDPMDVVVMDDAPQNQPRLVVAYPSTLLQTLTSLANALGAQLASVLALSAGAWLSLKRGIGAGTSLAVLDEGLMVVAQGTARVTELTTRHRKSGERSDGPSSLEALTALWTRLRLRGFTSGETHGLAVLALSPGDDISALSTAAGQSPFGIELPPGPGATAPRPLQLALLSGRRRSALDAVRSRPPIGTVPLIFALGLCAMAAVASYLAWSACATTQRLLRAVKEEFVRADVPGTTSVWSRDELPRIRAVNAAIQSLNLPVAALSTAMTPPRDMSVAVLEVELNGAASPEADAVSTVKIIAEASSAQDMANYVTFLAGRKPFVTAYLLRHEPVAIGGAGQGYRFAIEAAWPTRSAE